MTLKDIIGKLLAPQPPTAQQKIFAWRKQGCPPGSRPPELDDPFVEMPNERWVTVRDTTGRREMR